MAGCIPHRPPADQAMAPVDADVVLIAERRHGDVDPRRTVLGRLGLRPLHAPAGIPEALTLEHLQDMRDYVWLVAPEAQVEVMQVYR